MYIFMIVCYFLMVINYINLLLCGSMGYFHFRIFSANHAQFALFTILVFITTETLVMYFFIATGKSIKSLLKDHKNGKQLWEKIRFIKKDVFPHIMLTILLIGGLFIHGGAVDNRLPIAWLHGPLFIIAMLHHSWALIVKNRSFRNQIEIVSEMSKEIK